MHVDLVVGVCTHDESRRRRIYCPCDYEHYHDRDYNRHCDNSAVGAADEGGGGGCDEKTELLNLWPIHCCCCYCCH